MPCYLFTYHAHASWMPDNPRGYVIRGKGIQPSNKGVAEKYRSNLKQRPKRFDAQSQKVLLAETVAACTHQNLRCHFVATESTHLHVLVSWTTDRTWEVVRAKLRESLSRRLNREIERRLWFSKSPSRKRVKDRQHFNYLMKVYLPKHSGWKWAEAVGAFR
jgi:hypothetical protein